MASRCNRDQHDCNVRPPRDHGCNRSAPGKAVESDREVVEEVVDESGTWGGTLTNSTPRAVGLLSARREADSAAGPFRGLSAASALLSRSRCRRHCCRIARDRVETFQLSARDGAGPWPLPTLVFAPVERRRVTEAASTGVGREGRHLDEGSRILLAVGKRRLTLLVGLTSSARQRAAAHRPGLGLGLDPRGGVADPRSPAGALASNSSFRGGGAACNNQRGAHPGDAGRGRCAVARIQRLPPWARVPSSPSTQSYHRAPACGGRHGPGSAGSVGIFLPLRVLDRSQRRGIVRCGGASPRAGHRVRIRVRGRPTHDPASERRAEGYKTLARSGRGSLLL